MIQRNIIKHMSMSEIKPAIRLGLARVLLERNLPQYISIAVVDDCICGVDSTLMHLKPQFRKSQITQAAPIVSYCKNSASGRGKISFRLVGIRDEVREKLEQVVRVGGKTT